MTERTLNAMGAQPVAAIDDALERTALTPANALALHASVHTIAAVSEVQQARLSEEPHEVVLELKLASETDRERVREVVARRSRTRCELEDDGALLVRLHVPHDADAVDAAPASLMERIDGILDRDERRVDELRRMRDELDETNRGVVALYAELDNHSRELQLADQRKNEFLAMLAHELRNPLAALHLAAEDLEQGDDAARNRRAARVMLRQLGHLSRMVDDLLDVSRITRGKVEIDKREMDLAEAIRQALEPRGTLGEDHGIELRIDVPETPVPIEGDPTRIEQLVVNLVDNAFKYTPGPGRVEVRLEAREGEARLEVRDSGRGMTPQEIRDAFDLFVQHSAEELDRPRGGLGIGLTLVREIVTMHHGTVTAESEGLGHGTTFRVRVPLADAQTAAPVDEVTEPRATQAMRLLLVEDNEDFRELLASRLRRRGCEVREAADGAEALELLCEEPLPDAVVTDVGLPGMDGYALARAIRDDARLRSLRVVALTGYGGYAANERTDAAGFDSHLVKPVSIDTLLAELA